jgi:hypothetical protein
MTPTHGQIEYLVARIQADFLEDPMLALTLPAAQKRFRLDEVRCAGVLDALVEARVLTVQKGFYTRYFPRLVRRCGEAADCGRSERGAGHRRRRRQVARHAA